MCRSDEFYVYLFHLQVAVTPEICGTVCCSCLVPASLSKSQDLLSRFETSSTKIHDHSLIPNASFPSSCLIPGTASRWCNDAKPAYADKHFHMYRSTIAPMFPKRSHAE